MRLDPTMHDKKGTILFVDDDRAGRRLALFNLQEAGYAVEEAESGEQASALFDSAEHDLVITDLRMPGMSGVELLQDIRKKSKDTPVILVTAYGTIETAISAMKLGADDFVLKPYNKDQLLHVAGKALQHRALKQENRQLKLQLNGIERPIVTGSPILTSILDMIARIAPSDAPVLFTGESGTGKELFARRLHARSMRAEKPFVAVNCGAIPSELLEAELFGHEKGAFTGAVKERLGRFRQADGGTVFLDELGELPAPLQVKLLRVLQESVVDVLGRDEPVKINVRVVSASNKKLLVDRGAFREDLFYRINVVTIDVPPLRDHKEDIPLLVEYFVQCFAGGRELTVPKELMRVLMAHDWPGNVRELENVCKRLIILCQGTELRTEDLPPELRNEPEPIPLADSLQLPEDGLSLIDLEKDIILKTLVLKKWNVSAAANYLGVPRHVLSYRMEKYGIRRG